MSKEQLKKFLLEKELFIITNESSAKEILFDLKIKTEEDGFLTDIQTGEPVISNDDEELSIKKFGALLPGSRVFVKKNIAGYSQYLFEHE